VQHKRASPVETGFFVVQHAHAHDANVQHKRASPVETDQYPVIKQLMLRGGPLVG